jgi:hypothetical protein
MNSDESSLLHLMPEHKGEERKGVKGGYLCLGRGLGGAEFEFRKIESWVGIGIIAMTMNAVRIGLMN